VVRQRRTQDRQYLGFRGLPVAGRTLLQPTDGLIVQIGDSQVTGHRTRLIR
jgi:hypothetical protein